MVNRATSVSPNAPNNPAAKPGSALGTVPSARPRRQTISAVLVDDEKLASDELAYLLKEFADVEVIATASNGLEAVKLIADLEPDLVFLDVQMPGLDGMGVIEKLRAQGVPLPYFVMATAYDQYAVEAFRLEALDYLLKPVEKDRLAIAVERARKGIAERAKAAQLRKSAGFTAGQALAAALETVGQEQSPQLHRRRAGCGLRHHRRRPDHGGGGEPRRAVQLPHD